MLDDSLRRAVTTFRRHSLEGPRDTQDVGEGLDEFHKHGEDEEQGDGLERLVSR